MPSPPPQPPPALALIEFSSIAVGTRATDALAKKAAVEIVRAGTLQPGKYAVLFAGTVGDVEQSFLEGVRVGAEALVDRVLLPDAHEEVRSATQGEVGNWAGDTLGILETSTLAATLEAADAAIKGADVRIVSIRLGDGLGGKGLVHFAGAQTDVEAAIAIACVRAAGVGRQCWTTIMPRVDESLRVTLKRGTGFGEGW